MNAINRLKADHHRLSSKIAVLGSALEMGAEASSVLREVCFSISQQLREHVTDEERLMAACRRVLPRVASETWQGLAPEHDEASQRLQVITRLLWEQPRVSLDEVGPTLTGVMVILRHQMSEQEAMLFPFIELALGLAWGLQVGRLNGGALSKGGVRDEQRALVSGDRSACRGAC